MSNARDIEMRAADWIARRDRDDWRSSDARALECWLEESTENQVAYLRLEAAWTRADRLAALAGPDPGFSHAAKPRRSGWRIAAMLAICVLGAAGGSLLAASMAWPGRSLTTPLGGRALAPLEDGSKIELNTDTSLRVALNGDERRVWLERGEAYFDVARDPGRPFVVRAGDARIKVVGTRFVVRRIGDGVQVVVEDGKVQVDTARGIRRSSLLARPGDVVQAGDGAMRLSRLSLDAVHDALAWRHGQVVFQETTLAAAAEVFNRYSDVRLVVDGRAAEMRVGGVFDTNNVESFVSLLADAYGLKVTKRGDEIFVTG